MERDRKDDEIKLKEEVHSWKTRVRHLTEQHRVKERETNERVKVRERRLLYHLYYAIAMATCHTYRT